MDHLRDLLRLLNLQAGEAEAEAVALLLFSLVIANQLVAAEHPHQTRGDVIKHAKRLLLR